MQMALAGRGVSRSVFAGPGAAPFTTVLRHSDGNCTYPQRYTPFSSWSVDTGATMRPDGTLFVTMNCPGGARLWTVSAATGQSQTSEST